MQRTEGCPSFARKLAGDTTDAVRSSARTGRRATGRIARIDRPGKPTSLTGTITLEPDGAAAPASVVELEVKVKVPLRRRQAREACWPSRSRRGMDVEHEVGVAWLEGDG